MLCHHLWSPLQHHSWMCLTRKTLLLGPAQPASSLRPLLFVPGLEVARWRNRSLSLLLSFPASSAPQEASVPMKHPRSQTAGGWAQRGPRLAAATLPSGPLRSQPHPPCCPTWNDNSRRVLASEQTYPTGQGLRSIPGCLPQRQRNILITEGFAVAQTALSHAMVAAVSPAGCQMPEKPGSREGLVLP